MSELKLWAQAITLNSLENLLGEELGWALFIEYWLQEAEN